MAKALFRIRFMWIGFFLILLLSLRPFAGAEATSLDSFEVDATGNIKHNDEEIITEENPPQGFDNGSVNRDSRDPAELIHNQREGLIPPPDEPPLEDECGLYLAPSTIEGAGLGVFTSRHRSVGDFVGYGEIVIPMVEVAFYTGNKDDMFNPFSNYYWRGAEKGLVDVVADHRIDEVQGFVPGLDAAINCNLALINVENSGSVYDSSGLNRNKDPFAGAMTPYHTTPSPIVKEIPPGGELFKFYGDAWFIGRQDKFGLIPLSEDYPRAQKILDKFDKLQKDHFPNNEELSEELWDLARYQIGSLMWESRVMNALPYLVEDALKAAKSKIASLHQPSAIRSNEYLRQHGKCMDSIRPGPSTLESKQGGRGGFATRNFPKGTIITGSPLHHLPTKEIVTIYRMELSSTNSTTGEETWVRHPDDVVGYQMMLNYCYGHPQSTLLLCPYGSNIGYINHNKTLANVKIQWSQDGITMHNQTWLESKSLDDMEEYQVSLAFDYVATKDIQEGDELFLDYGDEFEEALNKHMARWKPPKNQMPNYTPAELYNKEVWNLPLRTDEEQEKEPYPENLELRCHSGLVLNYMRTGDNFTSWETRENGYPCRILQRYHSENKGFLYKAELKLPLEEVGRQYKRDVFNYFQKKDVPRDAIKFFNKAYTTDLFLPNTFRKEIGIPDEMFPDHWKNGPAIQRRDVLREDGPNAPYRSRVSGF